MIPRYRGSRVSACRIVLSQPRFAGPGEELAQTGDSSGHGRRLPSQAVQPGEVPGYIRNGHTGNGLFGILLDEVGQVPSIRLKTIGRKSPLETKVLQKLADGILEHGCLQSVRHGDHRRNLVPASHQDSPELPHGRPGCHDIVNQNQRLPAPDVLFQFKHASDVLLALIMP